MLQETRRVVSIDNQQNENYPLITVLLVFYLIQKMPIVALYMNTYVTMMLLVFLVFAMFVTVQSLRISKTIVISMSLEFIKSKIAGISFTNNIWSEFLEIFPVFVGCWLVINRMDKVIKVIFPVLLITYIITALTTYVGLEAFPDASRLLATGGTHYQTYFKYNIGGYGFIYSLVLLHPIFICFFKSRKKYIYSAIFTAVCVLCVFKSAYAMAALLFVVSCSAYLLPSSLDIKKVRRRMFVIAVLLVVVLIFVPAILNSLAQWDVLEDSSEKITDISNMIQGSETTHADTEIRHKEYEKSWETFLSNPILGALIFGEGKTGGHSYALDFMANWGIIGLIIIICVFVGFGKLYYKVSNKTTVFYYGLLFLAIVVVLTFFNTQFWSFELGFAMPIVMRRVMLLQNENFGGFNQV